MVKGFACDAGKDLAWKKVYTHTSLLMTSKYLRTDLVLGSHFIA